MCFFLMNPSHNRTLRFIEQLYLPVWIRFHFVCQYVAELSLNTFNLRYDNVGNIGNNVSKHCYKTIFELICYVYCFLNHLHFVVQWRRFLLRNNESFFKYYEVIKYGQGDQIQWSSRCFNEWFDHQWPYLITS